MISFLGTIVLLFGAALLQSTILARLPADLVRPDLVLILVWSWGILRGPERAILWATIGGFALDLLSATPFFSNAFALGIVGFTAWLALELRLRNRPIWIPLSAVPITVLYYLVLSLILALTGWPLELWATLTQVALPAAIANTLVMPVLYFLLAYVARRSRPAIEW